jgi:hypothetical protein
LVFAAAGRGAGHRLYARQELALTLAAGGGFFLAWRYFVSPVENLILIGFFNAQKFLDGNAIDFCQLQDLLAASNVSASFPIHQGCPGNAALLGRFRLRQCLFFAKQKQPCPIRVSARFWCSTHAPKNKRGIEP